MPLLDTPPDSHTIGQCQIIRSPLTASMMDGTVLHGSRYELADDSSARRRRSKPPRQTPLLCLASELGNEKENAAFALTLAALAGAPSRIYTLDMRGRGASIAKNIETSTIATDTDDLISFCDAHNLHGVDLVVSGRSVICVFDAAVKRPGLFGKIVFNDAAPEFDGVGIARHTAVRQRQATPFSVEDAIASLKQLKGDSFPALDETQWEDLVAMTFATRDGKLVPQVQPGLVRFSNLVNYDDKQPDKWTQFNLFKAHPCLLIRGERSLLITKEISDRMAQVHPRFREIVVEGQGHLPLLHTSGLAQSVVDFLNED